MTHDATDTATDADLLARLDAPDEFVRAAAAVELARRGHPDGLRACLRTITDAPEPIHAYSTPSVWQLVTIGAKALPGLLDSLLDTNPHVRLCARYAVEQITKRNFGFDGLHWPNGAYDNWARWWLAVGYDYDNLEDEREAAVARLRAACAVKR